MRDADHTLAELRDEQASMESLTEEMRENNRYAACRRVREDAATILRIRNHFRRFIWFFLALGVTAFGYFLNAHSTEQFLCI